MERRLELDNYIGNTAPPRISCQLTEQVELK